MKPYPVLFFQRVTLSFSRLLLLAFTLLFSTFAIATDYYQATFAGSGGLSYTSAQQLCDYYKTKAPAASGSCSISGTQVKYGNIVIGLVRQVQQCPQIDLHFFPKTSPTPTTLCEPLDGGYCRHTCHTFSMINANATQKNIMCTLDTQTPVTSCVPKFDGVCDTTDPYGDCYHAPDDGCTRKTDGSIVCPPNIPPPTPEPECNYGSTNAYCEPQGGACPSGYVPGTYNGKTICVKNSKQEPDCPKDSYGNYNCAGDPDDPNNPPNNPNDPDNGGCTSNCNNTTNHNTYNNTTNNTTNNTYEGADVDMTPVVTAVNNASTAIVNAVKTSGQSIVDAVTGVKTATEALKTSVDAVKEAADKTTDAVKTGFDAMGEKLGLIDESVKDGTAQAKADAEKQLKATEDQTKQDKEYQDWQKLTHECKAVTPPVTPEDFNNGSGAGDFINNTPASGGNPSQVNSKLCKFADSFEEYKNWMQEELPDQQPGSGNVPVSQRTMEEAGLSQSMIEQNYVVFSSQCPAAVVIPIKIGSGSSNLELSWDPMCKLAQILRPFIIAMAYLSGAYIVLGIGKGD